MTADQAAWLRTGPITAEQREATIASLRDGDLTTREAASLLGCTETEALALAGAKVDPALEALLR